MTREKKTRQEVIGDTMLDLGKLTFAGIVLAGIFDSSFNKTLLTLCGLLFCLGLLFIGVFLLTNKTKEE